MSLVQYNGLYDWMAVLMLSMMAMTVMLLISTLFTRELSRRFLFAVSTGVSAYATVECYMMMSQLQQSLIASEAGFMSTMFEPHWGMTLLGLTSFLSLFYYLFSENHLDVSTSTKPFIGLSFLMGLSGYIAYCSHGWFHWLAFTISFALWLTLLIRCPKQLHKKKQNSAFPHMHHFSAVHWAIMFSWFCVLLSLVLSSWFGQSFNVFHSFTLMFLAAVSSKFVFALNMTGIAYDGR